MCDGNFDAHSRHERADEAKTYECLSNEMKLNSRGFRQTTKGRSLRQRLPNPQPPNERHEIDKNNAFSYSLPILSRTVVNRAIRVKLRDCERELIGNNQFKIDKRSVTQMQEIIK